ncbi:MAG: flap endonuclease-1 [Candidatus Pacearchaeota archaeon]
MGLQISEIVPRKAIQFSDLKGKVIAVDASNIIYQFLSTIRQPDGTPLKDKQGRITSHLSGLFYRNINLLQEGLKLVYVFDGEMPELKKKTIEKRLEAKAQAQEKYEQALSEEDLEAMRKYSQQLTHLTPEIKQESIELLEAMGIQCIQAPGEAEAQAAYMAKKQLAWASASQDYDSLAFGTPRLIQNLTLARKRKTLTGFVYISPELIELEQVLNSLQINLDQLICLAILCGTDYNPGGIKGIGPKKGLEIVRKYKEPYLIFKSVEDKIKKQEEEGKGFNWQEIFPLFKQPNVKDIEIKFPKLNESKIKEILLEHDFSEERINSALNKLKEAKEQQKQKTLF